MAARAVALPLPIFAGKLAVFALGSFLLHSAACVLNDICDIEFDRQVGEQCNIEHLDMTSAKSAVIVGLVQNALETDHFRPALCLSVVLPFYASLCSSRCLVFFLMVTA